MTRFKSITRPYQTVLFLALLLAAALGAACGGTATKSSSTSPSSSASSATGGATAGAFEGEITYKMAQGTDMEVRHAIKGTRSRIETRLLDSGQQAQSSVLLMDMSSQTMTTLVPMTKTYTSLNWGEMADQASKEMGKMEPGFSSDFSKVTSTGKTETVAGVNCQYWKFGDKMELCLAQGLGYFAGGSGGILDQLKNLAQRDKIKAQLDANPEFAKFVEGGAFPLKMANIENGQSKPIMEATKIERKSLDDSLFTIPADYKKMELPAMMGIPTGRK